MNNDSKTPQMSTAQAVASGIGMFAVLMFLSTWHQYSRGQEFNAAPPQEETWQAAIHANTWDAAIALDAACAVRRRSAMHCVKGCHLRSVAIVECGGRTLASAGNTDGFSYISAQSEGIDEWRLEGGTRMVWDHAAGTLILESTAALEPRRLALKLAPTSTVVVDPHCRSTLRDAIGFDATPACGYAYLDAAMTPGSN